jgi:hypothetical protein
MVYSSTSKDVTGGFGNFGTKRRGASAVGKNSGAGDDLAAGGSADAGGAPGTDERGVRAPGRIARREAPDTRLPCRFACYGAGGV